MRSSLGRFHRPFSRVREEQLLLLNDLGDGSTLSLDFTTGVLDPRLTFTRGTNATFINSSGLVEWAAANMFRNTVWGSTSLPTGWLANASNTGTVTYNGNGTITCAATSQIAWIYPDFPYVVTQTGLSYICSFRVVSISGPTLITDILSTGNFTASDYFINGVSVGASPSAPSGNVTGPCVVSVRVNATSTSWFPRLGVGVQGLNRTATITMSEPHAHPGTVPVPYLANTSTSASNHNTPRFDHDPSSIGTPRGLLIEGAATNYSNYSETFPTAPASGTGWGRLEVTANATLQTSPDGTANAIAFNETINNSIHRISHVVTAVAGPLTCSVWVKVIDGSAPRRLFMNAIGLMGCGALFDIDPTVQTGASGSATGTIAGTAANRAGTWVKYPNGWYRCSIVGTYNTAQTMYLQLNRASSTGATDDTYAGNTSNGLMIWGFQIEAGTGASSYIPTGASQGNRALESCALALSAIPLVTSEGSFVVRYDAPRANLGASVTSILNTDYQATEWIGLFQSVSSVTVSLGSWSGQSNISAGTVTSNIAAFSYGAWTGSVVPTSFVVNNSAVTNANRDWNPALPTWLMIGAASSAGSSTANRDWLNSCIRSVKYWPTRLPDAQLKSLTT